MSAAGYAGSLGTIAGGSLSDVAFVTALNRCVGALDSAFIVNLWSDPVPLSPGREIAAQHYLETLAPVLQELGVAPSLAPDNGSIDVKVSLLARAKPALVSFSFGMPALRHLSTLAQHGVSTAITVTTVAEALVAYGSGADILIAQGADAGGPQAGFDPFDVPRGTTTAELVLAIRAVTNAPVIAAGGVGDSADVEYLLACGADLVQVSTVLLAAPESFAPEVYRTELLRRRGEYTGLGRTFSGRWERGLTNAFTAEFGGDAVAGFPLIAQSLAPLVTAAQRLDDPDVMPLWAGTGLSGISERPLAHTLHTLAGERG